MRIAILGPASPREFSETLQISENSLPVGIGGTPVNELVRALLCQGHDVYLLTTSPDIKSVHRFESQSLKISVIPLRPSLLSRGLDMFHRERMFLRSELQRIDVDVVHAHWTYEFAWATDTRQPTLITAHDAPLTILRLMPNGYRLIRLLMACRVFLRSKELSAVSPYLAAELRKQLFIRRNIRVIPNIVPKLPTMHVNRSEKLIIMDVATSSNLKNVTRLIRAFALVRTTIGNAELRLIGPGLDDDGSIAVWANREGLSSGVKFLGINTREQIAWHLAEATIFCHPSLEEAQPMSILEAMASNLPVIGGIESGGVAWTLGNGSAGVLVDVNNSGAIANSILKLYSDSVSRDAYILNAARLIENRFSPIAVSEAYISAYNDIIMKHAHNDSKGKDQ